MDRCPSGLRSRSWKPVIRQRTVGSNPTLSAKYPVLAVHFLMSALLAVILLICGFVRIFYTNMFAEIPKWWRGSPAKGVGLERGARVQIPLSAPSNGYKKDVSPKKPWYYRGFLLSIGQFSEVQIHRCKIAVLPLWVELNSRTIEYY